MDWRALGPTGWGGAAAACLLIAAPARAADDWRMVAEVSSALNTALDVADDPLTPSDECRSTADSLTGAAVRDWSGTRQTAEALQELGDELGPLCGTDRRTIENIGLIRLVRLSLLSQGDRGQTLAERLDATLGTNWQARLARL